MNLYAEIRESGFFELSVEFYEIRPQISGISVVISLGIQGASRPGSPAVIVFKLSAESGARAT